MTLRLMYPKEFARNPEYRTPPVAHQIPLATVRNNVYVLSDGSMVAVFRVKGLEYDLASPQQQAQFGEQLRMVLNTCPPGVQFKILHRIHHNYQDLLSAHEAEMTGKNTFARYVAWDRLRLFHRAMRDGRVLRSDNLVVITYNPQIRWWEVENKLQALTTLITSVAHAGTIAQRTTTAYRMALQKFEDLLRPITQQMRLGELKPERFTDAQLYDLAWQVLNPRLSRSQPCPQIRRPSLSDPFAGLFATGDAKKTAAKHPHLTVVAPISEREQLCASDWVVGDKWLRIDETYYGCIYVKMLPTHVYPGLALSLAGIPFEATVSIDAVMLQKHKELEKQWNEAKSAQSKAEATLFGAKADPVAQKKGQEMQDRYEQMASGIENPFALRMVVTVSGATPQELNTRCDAILSLLRNMENVQGQREHYGLEALFKTTWPFSLPSDLVQRKALTSHVASLLPMYSRWEGSLRPVTLFMDQLQRLVKHDPFPVNQLNRNKTVTGKSGSGKSFATQLADVQPHAARANTEILVVESGGSFELTTECFGGMFIKLGPSSPYHINPFDLPPGFQAMPKEEQEIELRYKYGFIKNLTMAMARLTDAESQAIAENVIGTVAQRTYLQPDPRFRDFYRLLGEYRNKEDPSAEVLAGKLRTRLANYVVNEGGEAGIFSHYFDTFTNFDANAPIITFDLIDIKNDEALLTPMMMVTLLGLIYNRLMKRDGTERLVIVDEAWALIKAGKNGEQSPAGQGIELFWREGRKLGASSAMISQNFSDMAGDAVGRAVVGNSPIQYFLVHERLKANDDAFRSANFSKEKVERVYNLKTEYGSHSEILLKEGDEWGVVRLPSVGLAYWLATTDPKDLDIRKRYFKTYGEGYKLPKPVIVVLLAEDYPGGYHGAHGAEMSVDEALTFAERWTDRYRRFSERVANGTPIPFDFE